MTVEYIILSCKNLADERDTYLDTSDRDLKAVLSTPEKATAAIRVILATGVPTQFWAIDARAVKGQREGVRRRKLVREGSNLEMHEEQFVLYTYDIHRKRTPV